jgi:hypothetical protein
MFHKSLNEILATEPVIQNGILPAVKALPEGESSDRKMRQVQYWTRGFGKRHWRMLERKMRESGYSTQEMEVFLISFLKFKVMRMMRPKYKKFFIWFWKHYLESSQQLLYKRIKTMSLDYDRTLTEELLRREDIDNYQRITEYLYEEKSDWVLPLACLPLIDVDKGKKMYLSLEPFSEDQSKMDELTILVDSYLESLNIKRLFMPPADCLFKVGNQKCADNGVVRRDRDHVQNIDGDFIYQRFITQPLTPREVWLPPKIIKYNNNFWMNIGRQFLKRDPIYPSDNIYETYERLRQNFGVYTRFDMSGFGFQIPREYIRLVAKRISLKYPSPSMSDHLKTLEYLFSRVKVRMPDGFVKEPTRGIGLGYYEDLKTMVIMSILRPYNCISIYGDQGLIGAPDWFSAIAKLRYFDFIVENDHIDMVGHNSLKWSGAKMTPESIITQKGLAEPLLGALFSSTHWERKNSLKSLAVEQPEEYNRICDRLTLSYAIIFGSEFGYNDELLDSLNGVGLRNDVPVTLGYTRTYAVCRAKAPVAEPLVDVVYSTPFGRKVLAKDFPLKEKIKFQNKRKQIYRKSRYADSASIDISSPLTEDRCTKTISERLIPHWSDLLFLFHHGETAGTLVSGLYHDDILKASLVCPYSKDPFRSYATGGYKVLTPHGVRAIKVYLFKHRNKTNCLIC